MDLFQSDEIPYYNTNSYQWICFNPKILLWIFYPLTMDLFQSDKIPKSWESFNPIHVFIYCNTGSISTPKDSNKYDPRVSFNP